MLDSDTETMQLYYTTETDEKSLSLFSTVQSSPEWYVFHVPYMYASMHRIKEREPVIREYSPKDMLVAELEDDILNYVPSLKSTKSIFAVIGLPANVAGEFQRQHPDAIHLDTRNLLEKLGNGITKSMGQAVTNTRSASSPSRAAMI